MDRNGRPKEDGARSDRGEMCYASRDGPPVELPRRRQRHRRRAPGRRFWQTIGNCGTAKQWGLRYRTPQGDLCQNPTNLFRGARRSGRINRLLRRTMSARPLEKVAPRPKGRFAKLSGTKARHRAMSASRRITDPNFPFRKEVRDENIEIFTQARTCNVHGPCHVPEPGSGHGTRRR